MNAKVAQLELFKGTSLRDIPSFRDDIDIMSLPFFGVAKTPRFEPIEHEFEQQGRRTYIRVSAGEDGIATVWDNDILMYLRTLLIDAMNRGEPISNRIRFVVHDYLRATGKAVGGSDYEAFLASLKRLKTTTIYTNITVDDTVEDQGFGWVQQFKLIRRRSATGHADVMAACEVVLSDWLFSAITGGGRSLSIDPVYFSITGGVERKLFMIARRHVGAQNRPWTISLEKLYARVGAQMPLRRFKFELGKLIERGGLPNFDMEMVHDLHLVDGKARKRRDVKVVFRDKRS